MRKCGLSSVEEYLSSTQTKLAILASIMMLQESMRWKRDINVRTSNKKNTPSYSADT
jgi:hypothetical protein